VTTIRQCDDSDLAACAKLFLSVFAEPPYEEHWEYGEAVEYLGKFLAFDPDNCYVAVADGAAIGMVLGYRYPWRSRTEYHIQELFVACEHRRRGIGRGLVEQVVRGLGGDVLVALVANERTEAARFYEALGITPHPEYRFYCGRLRTG
jgi:ribosomal protein S18 acetylase RimI-like enzyme